MKDTDTHSWVRQRGVSFLVIGMLVLFGCSAHELKPYADVPSGAFTSLSPEIGKLRKKCVERTNEAADISNRARKKYQLWSIILGLVGGISMAAAIIAATPPIHQRLGLVPVVVPAIFAALAALLTPLVVTSDKANSVAMEYQVLASELETGDDSNDDSVRRQMFRGCAYGHSNFETDARQRE